jgi:hypothetical protein
MDNNRNNYSHEDLPHPCLGSAWGTRDAADSEVSRREFLGFATASIFLAHIDQHLVKSESRNGIPYRALGHSGEKVSLVGLGG